VRSTQPVRPDYMAERQLGGVFTSFGPVGVLGSCTGHAQIPKTGKLGRAGPGWGPVFCDIWWPLVLVESTHSYPVLGLGFLLAAFWLSHVLEAW